MKVLMTPIGMVAWFTQEGILHPLKYKIDYDGEATVVKVDHILLRTEEKLAGNKQIIFRCQSVIDNLLKVFELKYEVNTCKWYLYKA